MLFVLFSGPLFAQSQSITLKETNAPLKKVFQDIGRQTGLEFLASSSVLEISKPVSINIKNDPLIEVLELIFKAQPLKYEFRDKIIIVTKKEITPSSQNKNQMGRPIISGKVVDTLGNPLPGATLKNQTSNITYTAGDKGQFELKGDLGDAIEVSYIGFTSYNFQLKNDQDYLIIKLKEGTSKLNEVRVVSTGYQTISKERATGSFTAISKAKYNEQVTTDVLSRLEAIANGMSVFRNNATATSQLMVRGLSTISGPTSPLIVVDNFPYEGDLNNLNPNDVESITILKDAAATSIWGTKAGNGVIVITTKKGKYNQPLSLEINSNVTVGNRPDLNYLTPMSSADYISLERKLFDQGYYTNKINNSQVPVLSPVIQLLADASNGTISAQQADKQIGALADNDVRRDFSKYFYRQSFNQQHYLSLSGGADNINYLFSTGYDKNISNLAADFDRLNIKSIIVFKPIKRLQINAGITYTASNNKSGRPGYGSISSLPPYQLLASTNGEAIPIAQTYNQEFKNQTALNGKLLDWNFYPLTDYQHDYVKTGTQDILVNLGAQYQLVKSLTIDIKYQYEKQNATTSGIHDGESYYARNLVNSFSQINNGIVTHIIPLGGIQDETQTALSSHDVRGQLNYLKDWNKNSVTLLAGEELREVMTNVNLSRNYGYDERTLTIAPVDYLTNYPNFANGELATIPFVNSLSQHLNRFVSFFANGSYTYDSKYTASASIRRDGSNLFGVETNDKWKPLWSAGLSWDISKEAFYHIDALPYLKFRATYGFSGNVDPSKSAVTTILYEGTSVYTNSPYAEVSNFANPDLRWEKVGTTNFGIDFRSKNERISGSIEYYQKSATDLYASVPVDYTAGLRIATVTKNAAAMKGHGMDIELNSLNVDKAIKWQTSLNLNYYQDKVTTYFLPTTDGNRYVLDSQNPVEGFPVWSVFSYRSPGLDANGNPQGYIDGKLSEDYTALTGSGTKVTDLKYSGPRFPVWYGTLANTFSFKGISVTANLRYNFGNYFRRQSFSYSSFGTTGTGNADYAKRWQNPGDEKLTNVPSFTYPIIPARDNFYNASEVLVEKADCVRLQYVTVSYSLKKTANQWLPFNHLQVYINANNLGILWRANKSGIDPEYTYTNVAMPLPKTIALGLRINP